MTQRTLVALTAEGPSGRQKSATKPSRVGSFLPPINSPVVK